MQFFYFYYEIQTPWTLFSNIFPSLLVVQHLMKYRFIYIVCIKSISFHIACISDMPRGKFWFTFLVTFNAKGLLWESRNQLASYQLYSISFPIYHFFLSLWAIIALLECDWTEYNPIMELLKGWNMPFFSRGHFCFY